MLWISNDVAGLFERMTLVVLGAPSFANTLTRSLIALWISSARCATCGSLMDRNC